MTIQKKQTLETAIYVCLILSPFVLSSEVQAMNKYLEDADTNKKSVNFQSEKKNSVNKSHKTYPLGQPAQQNFSRVIKEELNSPSRKPNELFYEGTGFGSSWNN